MKVYIVTSGEYSDYEIQGVFLDKDIAEKFQKVYFSGRYDYGRVEEYDTGDEDCKVERVGYNVMFNDRGWVKIFESKLPQYDRPRAVIWRKEEHMRSVHDYAMRVTFTAPVEWPKERVLKVASEYRASALAHHAATGETTFHIKVEK